MAPYLTSNHGILSSRIPEMSSVSATVFDGVEGEHKHIICHCWSFYIVLVHHSWSVYSHH